MTYFLAQPENDTNRVSKYHLLRLTMLFFCPSLLPQITKEEADWKPPFQTTPPSPEQKFYKPGPYFQNEVFCFNPPTMSNTKALLDCSMALLTFDLQHRKPEKEWLLYFSSAALLQEKLSHQDVILHNLQGPRKSKTTFPPGLHCIV